MPEIVSIEPKTVGEILESFITVGNATNRKAEAEELYEKLEKRLDNLRSRLEIEDERPRVFCLEWLDPPYVGGHWVPEMVELAGGESVLGKNRITSYNVCYTKLLRDLKKHFRY